MFVSSVFIVHYQTLVTAISDSKQHASIMEKETLEFWKLENVLYFLFALQETPF